MNGHSGPPFLPPEGRHLPLVFLALLAVNAIILQRRFARMSAGRPDLARGYWLYLVGMLGWLALPWVVMAVGLESGAVPNVFAYFHARAGNPWVLAFYGAIFAMLLFLVGWVILGKGAEFILAHPGAVRNAPQTAIGIRLWVGLLVLGGCVGMVLRFLDIPPVPF